MAGYIFQMPWIREDQKHRNRLLAIGGKQIILYSGF